jgi:hypothetical protein
MEMSGQGGEVERVRRGLRDDTAGDDTGGDGAAGDGAAGDDTGGDGAAGDDTAGDDARRTLAALFDLAT